MAVVSCFFALRNKGYPTQLATAGASSARRSSLEQTKESFATFPCHHCPKCKLAHEQSLLPRDRFVWHINYHVFLWLLLMGKFPVCMLLYFFLGCQWPEMYNKDYLPLFQPLGNAAMNTRVFKEPRGFMRCVQWFFAIVAFGCCCDFSTHVDYTVECTLPANSSQKVTHVFSYPFQ